MDGMDGRSCRKRVAGGGSRLNDDRDRASRETDEY